MKKRVSRKATAVIAAEAAIVNFRCNDRKALFACLCALTCVGIPGSFLGYAVYRLARRNPWDGAHTAVPFQVDGSFPSRLLFEMQLRSDAWTHDLIEPTLPGDWEVQHRCTGLWLGEVDWIESDTGSWAAGTETSADG